MLDSIDISGVVTNYLRGFRSLNTGRYRRADLALHYGVPLAILVAAGIWVPRTDSISNLLSGLAILTGLFLALLVFVFQLRLDTDERVEHQRTARLVDLIDALFHATVYAALVSGLATTVAVVVDLFEPVPKWGLALVVALGAHLVLTGLLVITRAHAAYMQLIDDRRRARLARSH